MSKPKRPSLNAEQKIRLQDLLRAIQREAPFVGIEPFSHNIIRLNLGFIASEFGGAEANKAVRKYKLTRKGFNEEPVEDE